MSCGANDGRCEPSLAFPLFADRRNKGGQRTVLGGEAPAELSLNAWTVFAASKELAGETMKSHDLSKMLLSVARMGDVDCSRQSDRTRLGNAVKHFSGTF